MSGKLDPRHEGNRLFLFLGAAIGVLDRNDRRERELHDELWRLIPFVKALVVAGEKNHADVVVAWRMALSEPMPFGMPPIGLPKDEP